MSQVLKPGNILERIALVVLRKPKTFLFLAVLFALFLSLGVTQLYVDVTNESMFRSEDKALQQYESFQKQFGTDEAAVAIIESKEIFSQEFLGFLQAYHDELEKGVPFLDEVLSLVSVTSVSDKDGEILIDDLKNLWPENEQSLNEFQSFVLSNPLFKNLIVTEGGDATIVVIRANAFATLEEVEVKKRSLSERVKNLHDSLFADKVNQDNTASGSDQPDTDLFPDGIDDLEAGDLAEEDSIKPLTTKQSEMFVQAVREISEKHSSDKFRIQLAGSQMIAIEHSDTIHSDLMGMLPITFVLVVLVLFVMLRKVGMVLVPTVIVLLTLTASYGFMGWMGMPLTPVAIAVPPLVLMIGIADSVHILSIFYSEKSRAKNRQEAIVKAMGRTGLAVLFTSLTTIAGFLSFLTAEIKPIAEFGVVVSFGVSLAFVLSVVMIPAFVGLGLGESDSGTFFNRWNTVVSAMTKVTGFSVRHSNKVLIGVITVVILCVPGLLKLTFSHDTLAWFQPDRPVVVATNKIDSSFKGTIPLEIVIDTGERNGIYDPDFMNRLQEFSNYTESLNVGNIEMGRTTSVLDTLKRIHAVINNEAPDSPIPSNEQLIAQELLLFESSGADDVKRLIDTEFSMVRVTVRMAWADAVDYVPLRHEIDRKVNELFGNDATVTVTGTVDLMSRALIALMKSMMSSYVLAFVTISLMLVILVRRFSLGMVSMVQNVMPILLSLAVMGYLGIAIDLFSILLGGIALGLAVDDTVHFMHAYRYFRIEKMLSMHESIENTVRATGPALLFTTLSLTCGFFIFVFSDIQPLKVFGVILCFTIVMALVFDLLITPAIINTIERLGIFSMNKVKPAVADGN